MPRTATLTRASADASPALSPPLLRRGLRAQTLKRDEAKRVSSHELAQCVFPALIDEAKAKGIRRPIFVFDNAPPHERAAKVWNLQQGSPSRFKIAAYSPDQNKPAEHAIANIKRTLVKLMDDRGRDEVTPPIAQELLRGAFERATPAASVKADVESLVLTMKVIAAPRGRMVRGSDGTPWPGTGGDWPRKGLR